MQLAFFQPLNLQAIGLPRLLKRFDGGVEIAMLLTQALDLALQFEPLRFGQVIVGNHAPSQDLPARAPRAGDEQLDMRSRAASRKSASRTRKQCDNF